MSVSVTQDTVSDPGVRTGGHIGALDGLRALSILLVLAAHMLPLGPKMWEANTMAARMGMSLFFCLSGFLIVSILHRNADVVSFLIRRVLRIVPAFVIYLLALELIYGIGWRAIAINLLFINNYLTEGLAVGPMGHLWSLSVEMQFYMAMALATLILGRRAVWLVPPAAIVITLLRVEAGAYSNIQTHLRVDEILSGGTLALVALYQGERLRRWLAPASRAIPVLLALVLLWMASSHTAGGWLNYLRPYFAAALVGAVIHCRIGAVHRILSGRIASYIARTSYALYIWHPLMIAGWMNSGGDYLRYLVKRPISFALSFGAAHVSTFWWEMHWQKLAKRLTRDRPPRGAAAQTRL